MNETFLNGKVDLHCGDMAVVLATLNENSIDSCVTDPPYHLVSIVKRFSNSNPDDVLKNATNRKIAGQGTSPYGRTARGFMGKQWDGGDVAFQVETWAQVYRVLKPGAHLIAFSSTRTYHRMACAIEDAGFEIRDQIGWVYGSGFPKSHNVGDGWGTALKPAWEPIVFARKPVEGTVAANVAKWGTGAINIDGCRIETSETWDGRDLPNAEDGVCWGGALNASSSSSHPLGRWPANIITDGSEEVVAAFPDTHSAGAAGYSKTSEPYDASAYHIGGGHQLFRIGDEGGSAARFFYTAKADDDDRLGSKHPTVKPLDLMQYLVRLVTPPKGVVLDLFAGTGTTGEAAFREGFSSILIEREPEYQDDIRRRMRLCLSGPNERSHESAKAKANGKPIDHGPLFADNYNFDDDLTKSVQVGFEHIRERKAAGGPDWNPK